MDGIAFVKNAEVRNRGDIMGTEDRVVCSKCGKSKRPQEFFKLKNKELCDMCKDCLTLYIDNQDPETFLWILEKFDVPYIESRWIEIYNNEYRKNPGKIGPKSVLGRYLRDMKLNQNAQYTFADTDKLNFKEQKTAQQLEREEAKKAELQTRLENGEISQAEFDTLTGEGSGVFAEQGFVPNFSQEYEDNIRKQLTDEDYQYLLLKWGDHYRPSQWVRLEELYANYENEYELNADREDVLKKICKVSLKIDEALDMDDIAAVDKLNRTYKELRSSAKFTEAQNKDGQTREIDSIGELVAFVEREGGIIPQYEDPIEYPKDKVDFVIKDIQNYINNLVRDELGLGNIIEAYIEKLAQNKANSIEEIMSQSFEEEEDVLTEEDVNSFSEFLADEIEQEAQALADSFE